MYVCLRYFSAMSWQDLGCIINSLAGVAMFMLKIIVEDAFCFCLLMMVTVVRLVGRSNKLIQNYADEIPMKACFGRLMRLEDNISLNRREISCENVDLI